MAVLATGFLRARITQDFGFHKLVASAAVGQNSPVLATLGHRLRAAVTLNVINEALEVQQLSAEGTAIGARVTVNNFTTGAASSGATRGALLFVDGRYLVLWEDHRDGTRQVYANTLECMY